MTAPGTAFGFYAHTRTSEIPAWVRALATKEPRVGEIILIGTDGGVAPVWPGKNFVVSITYPDGSSWPTLVLEPGHLLVALEAYLAETLGGAARKSPCLEWDERPLHGDGEIETFEDLGPQPGEPA